MLTFAIGLFVGLGQEATTTGDQPEADATPVVATENPPEPAPHDAPRGPELTNPLDMEFLARTTDGPEALALLKRAGDTWLEQHHDIEAATRCYLAYLHADPNAAPEPEDTWLLARLRRAATGEQRDRQQQRSRSDR